MPTTKPETPAPADTSGEPPLQSPMPHSPGLDREEPEFVDEADIPPDDELGNAPPPDDSAG